MWYLLVALSSIFSRDVLEFYFTDTSRELFCEPKADHQISMLQTDPRTFDLRRINEERLWRNIFDWVINVLLELKKAVTEEHNKIEQSNDHSNFSFVPILPFVS